MYASYLKDARAYFDWYLMEYSSLDEVVEVLQYTYLFGSRCLGQALREKKRYDDGPRNKERA